MKSLGTGIRVVAIAAAMVFANAASAQDMETVGAEPVARACQTYWQNDLVGYKVCVTEYSDGSSTTTVTVVYHI